ncbi:MAG TPA: aldo/keto reductase [Acidimicrobiales bacterium]|nr:aldo/keto reductase [Acidimicrobiales bacterium]
MSSGEIEALERARFGRSGHRSSRVLFGAAALGHMSQPRADQVLEVLLEYGVNHLDTAADYGDSELRLAPWLRAHPGYFFVATKTGERTADGARASLEASLDRLGVDRVDLIQLHNLVEEDEWQVAHGKNGALEALLRAKDEGLVAAIGVTGHGLRIAAMHRRSLERYDYDSVLLPYSYLLTRDGGYRAETDALLETCAERDVAVQTIKAAARRRWRPGDDSPHHSWYEPMRDVSALSRSIGWVLSSGRVPGQLFLNSSSDVSVLRTILDAARQASRLGAPSLEELEADVAAAGLEPLFDGGALERI